jgi:hypothetical protein
MKKSRMPPVQELGTVFVARLPRFAQRDPEHASSA